MPQRGAVVAARLPGARHVMRTPLATLAFSALLLPLASAQDLAPARPSLAESCAATYFERAEEARKAFAQWDAIEKDCATHAKAIEFFGAHCRFLSELEVAVRKLDDPNAFVCDTKKGRPKDLTTAVIARCQTRDSPSAYQERFHGDNYQCMAEDEQKRVGLVLLADMNPGELLELMCAGQEATKASCAPGLAGVEAARAKGKLPPSRFKRPAPAPAPAD